MSWVVWLNDPQCKYTSWMHTIPVKCGCWPEQDLSGKEPLTIYPHGCPNFYNFLCENKMVSHPRGRVYSPDEVLNEIFADPDSDLDKNSGEEEYEGESSPEEHSSSEDNIEGIGKWCVGHSQWQQSTTTTTMWNWSWPVHGIYRRCNYCFFVKLEFY